MIKQIGLLLRGRLILLITRMITDLIGLHSVLLPLLIIRHGRPILLIACMITERIGQHKVLLPINHKYNKLCDIFGF